MPVSIISLPVPLILLVHLHILEYPHANKPEYDHNIFNPRVRGLRDRTKLMEDICYFLVGRLEGGREGAKAVLPTYPCLQPSETLAFRTSLSKYFETLRHQSLYPSFKTSLGASGGKGKAKESIIEAESVATAWWWRDVVVRKSLLEECSGEKFERLMLSVSTHVLLRGSSKIPPEQMSALFRNQPFIYTDLWSKCQSARQLRSRKATLLLRRESDLKLLRNTLDSCAGGRISRFGSLATQKLISLADSKFSDLTNSSWSGEEGLKALHVLIDLAGIKLVTPTQLSSVTSQVDGLNKSSKVTLPLPLPIAAAHHPSNLRKLRKPVFNNAKSKNVERAIGAQLILSESLDAEATMYDALAEALVKAKKVSESLAQKMAVLPAVKQQPGPKLDLWTASPESEDVINLNTQPTTELLSFFGLDISDPKGSLDDRIDDLREGVLPPYPPVTDITAPRLPSAGSQPNVPSTSTSVESGGFGSPPRGGIFTSTPPPSVKPPSAYVQSTKTSARFSLARTRRPTLFRNVVDDEVDQIVHGTQDDSTEEMSSDIQTPKRKQPVNRIWTAGSARPKSTVKKGTPRDSFPMAALLIEPAMSLPSLLTSSLLHGDGAEDLNAMTPTFPRRDSAASWLGDEEEEEEDEDDPPSMTLRDILLHADTSQFDLLDTEEDEDSMLGNEESFEWN